MYIGGLETVVGCPWFIPWNQPVIVEKEIKCHHSFSRDIRVLSIGRNLLLGKLQATQRKAGETEVFQTSWLRRGLRRRLPVQGFRTFWGRRRGTILVVSVSTQSLEEPWGALHIILGKGKIENSTVWSLTWCVLALQADCIISISRYNPASSMIIETEATESADKT